MRERDALDSASEPHLQEAPHSWAGSLSGWRDIYKTENVEAQGRFALGRGQESTSVKF